MEQILQNFKRGLSRILKMVHGIKMGRRQIYEKAQLTKTKHEILKNFCKKNKINFLTSVFNENDIEWLSKISNYVIKIPSHEVYNIKLIEESLKEI